MGKYSTTVKYQGVPLLLIAGRNGWRIDVVGESSGCWIKNQLESEHMVDSHQTLDWLFQPDDSNGQVSDDDLELAYLLQHSQPGDENIQLLLVRRFAAEIHRLVVGWLVFDRRVNASSANIRGLVVDILAGAALQVEGFRGEESVRNWIYRLAIKHLSKLNRWKFIRRTGIALAEATALAPIWRLSAPSAACSGCAMACSLTCLIVHLY